MLFEKGTEARRREEEEKGGRMGKKEGVGKQQKARKEVSGGCVWRTLKLPTSASGTGPRNNQASQTNPKPGVKS